MALVSYLATRARTIISKFQCFNILKCACPGVVECERLGKRLTDDVACFVRKEELRIKRDDLNGEGSALSCELWVEGLKVKEDCLFGLCYFFYALAGDGDENEMFLIHDYTRLNIKQLGCSSLCGTRFYNNAAKSSGKCTFCCRRFVFYGL